jgi:hypothetical protein
VGVDYYGSSWASVLHGILLEDGILREGNGAVLVNGDGAPLLATIQVVAAVIDSPTEKIDAAQEEVVLVVMAGVEARVAADVASGKWEDSYVVVCCCLLFWRPVNRLKVWQNFQTMGQTFRRQTFRRQTFRRWDKLSDAKLSDAKLSDAKLSDARLSDDMATSRSGHSLTVFEPVRFFT